MAQWPELALIGMIPLAATKNPAIASTTPTAMTRRIHCFIAWSATCDRGSPARIPTCAAARAVSGGTHFATTFASAVIVLLPFSSAVFEKQHHECGENGRHGAQPGEQRRRESE